MTTRSVPLRLIEPVAWRDHDVVDVKLSLDGLRFIVESLERTSPDDMFTRWLADAYYGATDDQGNLVGSEF